MNVYFYARQRPEPEKERGAARLDTMKKEKRAEAPKKPRKEPRKEQKLPQPERRPIPVVDPDPEQGLSLGEVKQRLAGGWGNDPGESPSKKEKQIIKEHVLTYFNLVFAVLAVCLLLVGSYKNMTFLVIAIVNAAIGCFQEIRAKRAVDKLTLVAQKPVKTIRGGAVCNIRPNSLVRDDIVELGPGDQICADAVVRSGEAQVNESLITGEADAIAKAPGAELKSGSFVVSGRCRAQLTKVGPDSFAAHLAAEAKTNVKVAQSEMMRSLTRLIQVVGLLLIPIGVALFLQQHLALKMDIRASVISTVAALIGMIPEGLYLLTSVAMAVSARKLAGQKVLVQDMNCIETLARVDVLCVDKTGTITEPKMEVQDLIPLDQGQTTPEQMEAILAALYTGQQPENDTAQAMTDAFGGKSNWLCRKRVPFQSDMKWSAAVFDKQGTFVVGAPEFILGERYGEIEEQTEPWTETGCRVLLIARYDGKPELGKALEPQLVQPLALAVLSNKLREDAEETFRFFAQEGVSIRVISGDNPVTVAAVAQRAGIENAERYVDTSTLESTGDFDRAAAEYTVFGRVTPEKKRKLIQALQRAGHTVAMTGDGVNDVLALKAADCGIAMASGSQAASQVAQLVMLNSDFASLPSVVGEGRRVINNIQRAAALFLVKNIFSLILAVISLFATFPYPMVPMHLSMISALTIGVPSFFLALEPNHERVKGRFMLGVLRKALPGGLSNLVVVLLAEVFWDVFRLDTVMLYTTCAGVVSAVGLLVLFQVCKPFSTQRKVLWGMMVAAVIFCFVNLRGLFEFTWLNQQAGLITAALLLLTPTVFFAIQRVFDWGDRVYDMLKNPKERKRLRRNKGGKFSKN